VSGAKRADDDDPALAEELARFGLPGPHLQTPVLRVLGDATEDATAGVAAEVPIAFQYNGIAHAVMLATPDDLEDFALGFSFSEGLVENRAEFYGVEVQPAYAGITLAIDVATEAFARLKDRRRTLAGRTGCGICGTESLDQVQRSLPVLGGRGPVIGTEALTRAVAALQDLQPLQRATGSTHGAAWCTPDGAIVQVREDVGRHNALDKLIGALLREDVDTAQGFALITSRASIEMVQKSATAGIGLLAAVSAPTGFAVRTANACGQTLIGFARGAAFTIYTHHRRMRM
jgi:FdhD protein